MYHIRWLINTAISACTHTTTAHPSPLTTMWCTNCQQDGPALANGDMARCAQCGRFLKRRPGELPTAAELHAETVETTPNFHTAPSVNFAELDDDWTLQQRVRYLQRRLRLDEAALTRPAFHLELPLTAPAISSGPASVDRLANPPGRFSAFIAWFTISVGSLTFLSGAALLVWWFIDGSRELWSLGLPLTVAGQFGLLFGLVLQLNRLWRANRRIAESLRHLDGQLPQLNNSSALPHLFRAPYQGA
jgi:hypothetical protein